MNDVSVELLRIFFIALPPTLVAMAGLIVSLRNGRKQDETKADIKQVDQKADSITLLVDGNMSKVQAELATALNEIKSLNSTSISMQATINTLAEKLAISVPRDSGERRAPVVATLPAAPAAPPPIPVVVVNAPLEVTLPTKDE